MAKLTRNQLTSGTSDIRLSEDQLLQWQDYIEQQVGFVLPVRQRHWLQHGIEVIAKLNNMDHDGLLQAAISDEQLRQRIFDTVLIPESRFFRHPDSLQFIQQCAIEYFAQQDKNKAENEETTLTHIPKEECLITEAEYKSYRVWSVGCAYGQEPWSLAMILAKLNKPFKIWGSDVHQAALSHAISGEYEHRYLENVPDEYLPQTMVGQTKWQIHEALRSSVHFFWHNVFSTEKPQVPLVDAIVCQNVLIYFRQFDQRDILARLTEQLHVGGHLVLAPGEAQKWQHPLMQRVPINSINAWKKIG